jgi:hypothetical protein
VDIGPPRVPLTPSAVCAWRPRRPIRLCGWRGQGPGLWAFRLLESRAMCRPSCCFRWPVVGRHSFMARSCGDDMTKPNFLRGSSSDSCFLRARQSAFIACLSGQRRRALCAHFCARAPFDPHSGLFLMVLPSLLHAVLCFRRPDFAAQTVGFLGRSCQRERTWEQLWLAYDPSTEVRCVGPGLFFRRRSWFG